jgi:hypothetical protein
VKALFVSLLLLAACGGGGGGGGTTCPNDLPRTCPNPAPSYSSQVVPVLQNYCTKCHSAGGIEAAIPLTDYQHVFQYRQVILDQVYHCVMPVPPNPVPNSADRAVLLGWLVCGAPNN